MNRIEERLQQVQKKGEKAFIVYTTAGLPDMAGCARLVQTLDSSGIDVVELGIPFSDPVADGPVIQAASYKSIQQGTNLRKVFDILIRSHTTGWSGLWTNALKQGLTG